MSVRKFAFCLYRLALALFCACALPLTALAADDVILLPGKPSKDQILDVLAAPPGATESNITTRKRARRTRGLSLNSAATLPVDAQPELKQQALASVERKLDLQILFAFNSDQLTREGMEVLDQLGAALDSERLDHVKRVTLEGHTDSIGSAAYNQELSRRRAERVRAYLISRFGAGGRDIRAVGKGAHEPADPAHPEDGVNRRVRIIVDG